MPKSFHAAVRALARRAAPFISAAVLLVLAFAPEASAAKRLALVVGNDRYQAIPALGKAVNDARGVSEAFARLGFEVTRIENAGRGALSVALANFEQRIEPGDVVAFFFAGHGFENRGVNYLLPIDVPAVTPGQEGLVKDSSFAADQLVDRFQTKGAKTVFLVLDACRDNPFPQIGTRSAGGAGGLARMDAPEGVFILFSAGQKQLAIDGLSAADANPNSVFTRTFLVELGRDDRTLVEIAKATQVGVKALAASVGHVQTPAYYDQIVGDVRLARASPGRIAVEAPPPPRPAAPPGAVAVLPGRSLPVEPPPPQPQVAAAFPGQQTAVPPAPAGIPPIANFMRSNAGWTVTVQVSEPAVALAYRVGESGEFEPTGHLPMIDPRTSRPMAKPNFELPADQPATTLYVEYENAFNQKRGPFPIAFNPLAALAAGQQSILDQTWTSWVAFRAEPAYAHLLYTTHLVTYRCAISRAALTIDGGAPQFIPLPPCDPKDPHAVPAKFNPWVAIPKGAKEVAVQVTYADGTVSRVRTFRR